MNSLRYTLFALLFFGMPALSQLTTVIEAVEASTSLIYVPASADGNLRFKPCAGRCDAEYISVRLQADTRFLVQGELVSFAEFRRDFYNLRRGTEGYALVSYNTEKNTATSVAITF